MRLLRAPFPDDALSRAGLIVLACVLGFGALGWASDLLGDPARLGGPPLRPPSASDPMGADHLGRSMLARTAAGVRQSILLSATAVLIAMTAGVLLGMLAGYFRGWVDELVCRTADTLYAFPAVVTAILIGAMIRPGGPSAIAAVALVTLPIVVRMVRAATLGIAVAPYVTQARIMGASAPRILATHVLPNLLGVVAVQAAYSCSFGMIVESGISFLGLGVQPPAASLGSLIYEGRPYLAVAPWLVFFPGAVLVAAILSLNLVGDGLRRALDVEPV